MAYDAIIIGAAGGAGTAAAWRLARRGARVLGLDQFAPGHDRGSSHGRSRIIRQAYFEHPDYVPLVLRAYGLWAELEQATGRGLMRRTGLLQVGPRAGRIIPRLIDCAARHSLPIDVLTAAEIPRRFPGFVADEDEVGVFEHVAGVLRVDDCVRTQAEQAAAAGATFLGETAVRRWTATANEVRVETDHDTFTAARLVIAPGAWARALLAANDLGFAAAGLEVRRKMQLWYRQPNDTPYDAERGCPAFLYETPNGIFYGFPRLDVAGLKAAEHTGGTIVVDPLAIEREPLPTDRQPIEEFLARRLPLAGRELEAHAACLYTMTADENFIVDRHPQYANVCFAAGLSGHGFKFAPVLGEVLADLALDGRTTLPIEFLSLARFAQT